MNKSVGIREVAAAAGVSVMTVSHVLNDVGYARVGAETRERVHEPAQRLGYGPNRLARALRNQRSGMIGFISEEIATTPHAGRQADGILYATMYHRNVAVPKNVAGVPAVLVDSEDISQTVSSVIPDEAGGARSAVQTLINAGHPNRHDQQHRRRPGHPFPLHAYKETLADAGLPSRDELVQSEHSEVPGGDQAALRLLKPPGPPTAVFCYNDRMAMGAYRAAAELGLRIPEDVSFVGFDNQRLIAENLHPALTTVALPHYETSAWATENLIDAIEGKTDLGSSQPTRRSWNVRLSCGIPSLRPHAKTFTLIAGPAEYPGGVRNECRRQRSPPGHSTTFQITSPR